MEHREITDQCELVDGLVFPRSCEKQGIGVRLRLEKGKNSPLSPSLSALIDYGFLDR